MNNRILKLCRYLAAAALVLEVVAGFSSGVEISSFTDFLNYAPYISYLLIAVALVLPNRIPVIIGCGLRGIVYIFWMIRSIFRGDDFLNWYMLSNISAAVSYILVAVSLLKKKNYGTMLSFAIIIRIAALCLYFLHLSNKITVISLLSSSVGSTIRNYIYILISILAFDKKDMPAVKKKRVSAPSKNPIEELTKLKGLLDMGAITQEEFEVKKKELINL